MAIDCLYQDIQGDMLVQTSRQIVIWKCVHICCGHKSHTSTRYTNAKYDQLVFANENISPGHISGSSESLKAAFIENTFSPFTNFQTHWQ